jgi:hypothetical protein
MPRMMDSSPSSRPGPAGSSRRWALITALVCVYALAAAVHALTLPPALAAQIRLPVALEVAGGLLWALVFGALTVALLQRRPHAGIYSLWAGVGFLTFQLLRWWGFVQADYDRQRLPLLTGVVLVAIVLMLLLVRRATRPNNGEPSR